MNVQRWCLSLSNILFHLLCHMSCVYHRRNAWFQRSIFFTCLHRDILPRYSLSLSHHFFIFSFIFSFIFLTTECILEIAIHTCLWKCFQVFSGSLLAHFPHYGLLVAPLQVLRVLMLSVYPFPLNMFLRGDLTSHLNTSVCSICCILFRLQL